LRKQRDEVEDQKNDNPIRRGREKIEVNDFVHQKLRKSGGGGTILLNVRPHHLQPEGERIAKRASQGNRHDVRHIDLYHGCRPVARMFSENVIL